MSTTSHVIEIYSTFPTNSALGGVVTAFARAPAETTRWPLVLMLAAVIYWFPDNPNTAFAFFFCILRVSFTIVCILTALQRPSKAFKTPARYAFETAVHLVLAGGVSKLLIASGPAQVPQFVLHIHFILCSVAFSMAGTPLISVPLPQTGGGAAFLLVMYSSTLLGVVLPMLRWYLYVDADNFLHQRKLSPWEFAQVASVGSCTVSALWLVLAQISAAIE
jgi:hypothetical protein